MRESTVAPVGLKPQAPRSWSQVGAQGWLTPSLGAGCVGTVFMLTFTVTALFHGSQLELTQSAGPEVCLPQQ